jgi:hypothetical protein
VALASEDPEWPLHMDTQNSQNEDLKKWLKEATDIIKSRDETIASREAQIAGLQSELDDLRKQLSKAKLTETAELEADLKKTKGDPEKPCLELQDALSKQLPPEIHHKMLPACRTIDLRQTSRTIRTAVEKANVVVQARHGVQIPDSRGLLDKLNSLSVWCKVTVLRLERCGLGKGRGQTLAEALPLNATLTSIDLHGNSLGEGGGRAMAEALRLSITLTSLGHSNNRLGEGGGRALAEALRLNTTLTWLDLGVNDLGEGRGRSLAETLCLTLVTPRSRRSSFAALAWERAEGGRWQRH